MTDDSRTRDACHTSLAARRLPARRRTDSRRLAAWLLLWLGMTAASLILPSAYVALVYEENVYTAIIDGTDVSGVSETRELRKRYEWLPGPAVLWSETRER